LSRLPLAVALSTLLAATALHAEPAEAAKTAGPRGNVLRVIVRDVADGGGHVRVDVCSRAEFLGECRFSGSAPATLGVTTVEVRDLPPGVYAVQAYHDRNDNRTVDRNFFGLPTEAVGFSNDAPVRLSGPSFDAAAFNFPGGEHTIALRLRRFVP
jgi:uncharacterized protein (DUF2141 family)